MALCCSGECRSYRVKDSSPVCSTEKSCSLGETVQGDGQFPFLSAEAPARVSGETLRIVPEQGMPWPDGRHVRLHSCPPQPPQKRGLSRMAPTSLQAAGTTSNFILWGMLWGAVCGGVSSVSMRTTWAHFRSLHAGKPGETCMPVPPGHPSQPREWSWSEGCCSPTLLMPNATSGGASPAVGAPFGENVGSACLRWSRLTGTCLHRIAKSALCAVRSLLLPQVQQCSSFLPGSY